MSQKLFAVLALCAAGCAPRAVALDNIARIETEKRYSAEKPGEIEQGTIVVEGERLNEVFRGASCREGNAPWKDGVPAMVTLKVGAPMRADGFNSDGRLFKLSPNQWCELSEEGWRAMWRQEQ